jgi:hypothetical protein
MESTPSIWKSCLKYGIIMGLVSVVLSVLIYMLDLTFATWIIIPVIIVTIITLFLLQRSYRDTYENGYISYGKSLGAGMIIFLYSAIIVAVYTYLLYKVIDPGLIDKTIAASTAKLEAKGLPEASIDAGMKMQAKMLKPGIISITQVFNTLLTGLLMSLVSSIFIAKKGNPLTENE